MCPARNMDVSGEGKSPKRHVWIGAGLPGGMFRRSPGVFWENISGYVSRHDSGYALGMVKHASLILVPP